MLVTERKNIMNAFCKKWTFGDPAWEIIQLVLFQMADVYPTST